MKLLLVAVVLIVAVGLGGYALAGGRVQLSSPDVIDLEAENARALSEARLGQHLSNTLFEVVPGEVISSPDPEGARYDVRFRIRNFDTQRTLQNPFWSMSAQAFDSQGNQVPVRAAILPSGIAYPGGVGVQPSGQLTSNLIVVGRGIRTFAVTLTYDEPGTERRGTVSFVYPYGR